MGTTIYQNAIQVGGELTDLKYTGDKTLIGILTNELGRWIFVYEKPDAAVLAQLSNLLKLTAPVSAGLDLALSTPLDALKLKLTLSGKWFYTDDGANGVFVDSLRPGGTSTAAVSVSGQISDLNVSGAIYYGTLKQIVENRTLYWNFVLKTVPADLQDKLRRNFYDAEFHDLFHENNGYLLVLKGHVSQENSETLYILSESARLRKI